jgi:hypothetical protein
MNENYNSNTLDEEKIKRLKYKIFEIEKRTKTKSGTQIERELKKEIERIVDAI